MNAKASRTTKTKAKATFRSDRELKWSTDLPGHHNAISKMLVRPENSASKKFDFRISVYQPGGYAERHSHRIQEQLYYILDGEAVVEIDGVEHVAEAGTVMFFPPGVEHAIANSGNTDLVFVLCTTPPDE